LAALLWGDKGEGQARDGLRHALLFLRGALSAAWPSAVQADAQTVAVDPAVLEWTWRPSRD